jgi:hypothetical protein
MDPYNEVDRNRLFDAVEKSYKDLEWGRNLFRGLVAEAAGSGYGASKGPKFETVVNLINQAVEAYQMSLVANRPRVMMSSKNIARAGFARHAQEAINNHCEKINLESTLKQWVQDAFYCVGIIKLHRADSGYVQLEEDFWADPGKPFASTVNLDNWVHDTGSTKYSAVRFSGDTYRIPYEDLKNGAFAPEAYEENQPSSKSVVDNDRLESFSRGETVDKDDFMPMIDLADIWIPRTGMIYTFVVEDRATFRLKGKPIAEMPCTDDYGPYELLGFSDVPENIMPSSPAAQIAYLARLLNNLIRKLSKQAQRQKSITTYSRSGSESAKKVQRANDGDVIEVDDVKEIGQISMGGVDAGNQAFFLGTMQLFDRMSGNPTAKLGLGSQAKTLGQEELIHGAVNDADAHKTDKVTKGITRIVRSLWRMIWEDQALTIPGRIPINGAPGYSVDATWTPWDREGSVDEYELDIDIYSLPYQSPQQKVQSVNGLMSQVYVPMMQVLQQQGGQIDLQKLTEFYATNMNVPDLNGIVTFANAMPPEDAEGAEGQSGPSSTSREYIRRSVPGGTPQNQAAQQQADWLSMANRGQPAAA